MKNIQWLTSDCFIDVDLPILTELCKYYNITWYIVLGVNNSIDYTKLVNSRCNGLKIKIHYVKLKYRMSNPLIIKEYFYLVKKTQKSDALTVYYNISGMPYLFTCLYPFINKNKTIIAMHNVETPKGASHYRIAKIYNYITKTLYKNFQVFSISQLNLLKKTYPNKNILYAPLALKNFGNSTKSKSNILTFLFFGYIREYKRVDVLIEAAQKVYNKTKINFKVCIAGSCSNWSIYEKLIVNPEHFDLKIYNIPNEEIPDLFTSAHYFVMPYQGIAQSGAMSVALHYNIPIIASNLPAFHEFMIDNKTGYFIDVANIESLSIVMEKIVKGESINYDELCKNEFDFVKRILSIEAITENYIKYINNLDF